MANFFGLIGVFAPLFVVLWLANMSERQRQVRDESGLFAFFAYLTMASIYRDVDVCRPALAGI